MNLGDFLNRIKLQVPNMNEIGVTDTYLTTLLNQACNNVNLLTKVYAGYTEFNIVAEQRIYSLSTVCPTYLGTDKRGMAFKDSDGNWQMDTPIPKSEAWVRNVYPDYLNSTSVAIPQWYWIEGDNLGFEPPPSTSTTLGARLYHLKKASNMSSNDDYPFSGNSSDEITALLPLDDAIIAYVRWKLAPAFGQVTDLDLREREYINECHKGAMQIKRRRDISNNSGNNRII